MTAPHHYDVVIVGAGVTGAILANKLGGKASASSRARGRGQDYFDVTPTTEEGRLLGTDRREPLLDNFLRRELPRAEWPVPEPRLRAHAVRGQPQLVLHRAGVRERQHVAPVPEHLARVVGGTTNHWLGTCFRLVPSCSVQGEDPLSPRRRLAHRLRRSRALVLGRRYGDRRFGQQRGDPRLAALARTFQCRRSSNRTRTSASPTASTPRSSRTRESSSASSRRPRPATPSPTRIGPLARAAATASTICSSRSRPSTTRRCTSSAPSRPRSIPRRNQARGRSSSSPTRLSSRACSSTARPPS